MNFNIHIVKQSYTYLNYCLFCFDSTLNNKEEVHSTYLAVLQNEIVSKQFIEILSNIIN